jgi:Putative lumazine-binding
MQYIRCLLTLALLAVVVRGNAQNAEDSVKAAVNQLFTGMKTADPALVQAAFADSGILQTISTGKDNKTFVKTEAVGDFAAAIAKLAKGVADEQIRFDVIKIDGELAMVWAPYSFYYNGHLHHCGVDSFQLVRLNGVWKIQYIIDTRRKDPCP